MNGQGQMKVKKTLWLPAEVVRRLEAELDRLQAIDGFRLGLGDILSRLVMHPEHGLTAGRKPHSRTKHRSAAA